MMFWKLKDNHALTISDLNLVYLKIQNRSSHIQIYPIQNEYTYQNTICISAILILNVI